MQLASILCVLLVAHAQSPFFVSGARLDERCQVDKDCKANVHIECRYDEGLRERRCSCAAGYVQHTTLEIIKQECLRPVTPTKRHGAACSWGECLDPFVCKDGTCECSANEPTYNAQKQECEQSTHGGPCLDTEWDKHENEAAEQDFEFKEDLFGCKHGSLQCNNDVCTCAGQKHRWHEPSGECEAGYLNDDCAGNDGCHEGTYEDDQNLKCVAKKCVCENAGFPTWNAEDRTCDGLGHGDVCSDFGNPKCTRTRDLECKGGKCSCRPDYPRFDPGTKKCYPKFRYNEPCTSDECEHALLSCINGICSCRDASQEFVKRSECRTRTKKEQRAPCTSSDECMVERNAVCDPGHRTCTCRSGEIYDRVNFCRPELSCSNNGVCEPTGRVCRRGFCECPPQNVFSLMSQTCKLDGGQGCFGNNAPNHDACASGACVGEDTNTPELGKKCACAAFGAIEHVWSSEKGEGCVANYIHLPCNPDQNNADCRPSSFKNGRVGLVCVEHDLTWTCECSDPSHVFFQGYCVLADRGQGEDCDPVKGPVCKLDPDLNLVCSPSTKKCECQPRVMTSVTPSGHTAYAYFPSHWNETLERCVVTEDMTPPGERCSDDKECQSEHCKNVEGTSMCGEMELPPTKSTGIQISTKRFLCAAPLLLIALKF